MEQKPSKAAISLSKRLNIAWSPPPSVHTVLKGKNWTRQQRADDRFTIQIQIQKNLVSLCKSSLDTLRSWLRQWTRLSDYRFLTQHHVLREESCRVKTITFSFVACSVHHTIYHSLLEPARVCHTCLLARWLEATVVSCHTAYVLGGREMFLTRYVCVRLTFLLLMCR